MFAVTGSLALATATGYVNTLSMRNSLTFNFHSIVSRGDNSTDSSTSSGIHTSPAKKKKK